MKSAKLKVGEHSKIVTDACKLKIATTSVMALSAMIKVDWIIVSLIN